MLPVHTKTADFKEPHESVYYLLAANGVFLVKRTDLYRSITRTDGIAGLEQQRPSLSLRVPRVPTAIVERIYGFFDFAFRTWDGEAVAFVYYNPSGGEFRVEIPPQRLFRYRTFNGWRTEGRVEYGFLPRPEGFLKLCDFHSHAAIPAFFSSTDDDDDSEDGLRVVMGKMDRPTPQVCASFVAAGVRFEVAPADVLESFSRPVPPPEEWVKKIVCACEMGGSTVVRRRSADRG